MDEEKTADEEPAKETKEDEEKDDNKEKKKDLDQLWNCEKQQQCC